MKKVLISILCVAALILTAAISSAAVIYVGMILEDWAPVIVRVLVYTVTIFTPTFLVGVKVDRIISSLQRG